MYRKGLVFVILLFSITYAREHPTLLFLNYWPSARITGLAGCFISIADDAYTAYYNPAGLPFLEKRMGAVTYNQYLPGFYPDMHYVNISYSFPFKENQGIGLSVPYHTNRTFEYYDEYGHYLGKDQSYAFAIAASYGNKIKRNLSIGGTVKLIYYQGYDNWWWYWLSYYSSEIPTGPGLCYAADLGLLYKPVPRFNIGFTIRNFGTKANSPELGESYSLPFQSRLGIKYGPITTNKTKTLVAIEFTKNLVGMFYDPGNTKTFFQELQYELQDIYKGIGVEFSAYDLFHLRAGYYEDITNQEGGVVITRYGRDEHISICDYLFNSKIRGSKIYKVGLTYSVGITYKNASVDIGTDQYIYDFHTSNWKFTLSYQF